ncbi:hypothetical protein SAZ11_03615 [Streptomyces sp. FXJ1.4098]|nr:hypothetical protein [Streptomyces sp. FXJ1.4098]
MSAALRRTVGVATLLVAIAVALWPAFGPPSDGEGGIGWLRHGLVLGCLGAPPSRPG